MAEGDDANGSFISAFGETAVDLRAERRERVWRKVDLRLGGVTGRAGRGRTGTLACSLRVASSSSISMAERVRVRWCVGAVNSEHKTREKDK